MTTLLSFFRSGLYYNEFRIFLKGPQGIRFVLSYFGEKETFMRELLGRAWVVLFMGAAACGGESGGTPPLDERLGPGEVRAGVITKESELMGGIEAHGWIGDYKIYNSKVAFVVQNAFEPRGWGPYGGSLLDADVVREEGEEGHEEFQELFLTVDLLSMQPNAAEVVADGSDGQAAVVRFTGKQRGIPILDTAISGSLEPKRLEIVNEYILEPDARYLRIRTSLRSRGPSDIPVTVGDLVLNGDRAADFVRYAGVFTGELAGGQHPFLGGFSENSCNLYTGTGGDIRVLISIDGVTPLQAGEGDAGRDQPLVVERRLIIGDGGMDACLRTLNEMRGETGLGLLGGTVSQNAGGPEAGATVLARDLSLAGENNYVNQAYTGESGAFEMQLPAGDYQLEVRAAGRDHYLSETISVAAGQTARHDASVPAPAHLAYDCRDGSGASLPCKIVIQSGHDAAMSAGVHVDSLHFGASGQGEFIVPAGDWTVTLSRGWEYTIHRQNITVAAGETAEVAGTLVRQVDTTGFVTVDVHSHSTRSVDSGWVIEDKIASNICETVEVLAATDHDCQADLSPFVGKLGQEQSFDAGAYIQVVTGSEISPLFAHSTAFPLPTHSTGWIYWQIPWTLYEDDLFVRQMKYPEIWPRARELGAQVINAAHPMDSSSAYFRYLGFDPPDSLPRLDSLPPEELSLDFDTFEMRNGCSTNDMLNETLPVWISMNNQGVFKTAAGGSDVHERDSAAGRSRTLVASSTDDPREIDLDEIWTNLKQGRAMLDGGIFITIGIQGGTVGDLVTAAPPFDVHLRVQAADWVPAEQVILMANGQTVATLPLEAPGQVDPANPAVRFDGNVPVTPAADTWYAALATGPEAQGLEPVYRGCRAVGLTNALLVDVDGNGRFDPPEL